jgi:hypothetical protein
MVKTTGQKEITGGVTLTPIASAPSVNNTIWIDSTDSYKLKLRDNSGSSRSVIASQQYGYIVIDSMAPASTASATSGYVALNPVLLFSDSAANYAHFSFMVPDDLDTSADMVCEIAYCMASANSSASVVLGLDSNSIADGEDATPTTQSTTSQTISVPNTLEELDIVTTSTLKIPTSILGASHVVSARFYRDGASGSDSASGNFELLNFRLRYTRK